ncbi:hypothetical protein CPSG_04817 [Coccidioides posadasii str. Silveira]|uniref:Uncharacterized protein n=1 Tax=Coccidioides posadasii (strain RMSCC 757 / Silveira) TaxID=443226 RepID=E9D5D7_COCPS|nr:hypothetical protein CPSG_04817 [Coccidioides posadasii str. Silveira]
MKEILQKAQISMPVLWIKQSQTSKTEQTRQQGDNSPSTTASFPEFSVNRINQIIPKRFRISYRFLCHIEFPLPRPIMDFVKILACMRGLEIRLHGRECSVIVKCDESCVCLAHERLADNIDTVVCIQACLTLWTHLTITAWLHSPTWSITEIDFPSSVS